MKDNYGAFDNLDKALGNIDFDSMQVISIGVGWIELFRKYSGLSRNEFLSYMNMYNIWGLLFEDPRILLGSVSDSISEIFEWLGYGLPNEQVQGMLKRYKLDHDKLYN